MTDKVRLEIDGPIAVGKLADDFPVSRPAISQHLRILKDANLVTDRADGTRRRSFPAHATRGAEDGNPWPGASLMSSSRESTRALRCHANEPMRPASAC